MRLAVLLALDLVVASCAGFRESSRPEAGLVLPARFGEEASSERGARNDLGNAAAAEGMHRWWRSFGDEDLSALVERSLASAPRVRVARARVARARALAAAERARYFPSVETEIAGARTRQVASFPETFGAPVPGEGVPPTGATDGVPETFESRRWTAELVGTAEPDLFGRTTARARAADEEAAATRAELDDVTSELAAALVRTWFGWIAIRAEREVRDEQVEGARAQLALVRGRYERGLSAALELAQQEERLATVIAEGAVLEGRDEGARRRLAVLAGSVRAEDVPVPREAELPDPPPLPPTGVPADLLRDRPDVVAARRRVRAADHRVAAAVADYFPSLVLQGAVGYGAERFRDLFRNVIWSGVVSIAQPLFAGGERFARRDEARAAVRQALGEYADTVAQAMVEVEDALSGERRERQRFRANVRRVEAAERALGQARLRYERGLTELDTVIEAERALLAARLAVVDAKQAWLDARVAVHQALGGRSIVATLDGEQEDTVPRQPRDG